MQSQNIWRRDYFERQIKIKRRFFALLVSDQGKVRAILKQPQFESLKAWVTDRSLLLPGHCARDPSLLQTSGSLSAEWLMWKVLASNECPSSSVPEQSPERPVGRRAGPWRLPPAPAVPEAPEDGPGICCFVPSALCWVREFALTDRLISRSWFFCLALCFWLVAVLQKQVCCLLRVEICHPLWKVVENWCNHCNEKWIYARLENEIPGVLTLLPLSRKSRCF